MSKDIYSIQKCMDRCFNIKFVPKITNEDFERLKSEGSRGSARFDWAGMKHTEESKKLMSEVWKGRTFSAETKRKISETMKRRYADKI